MSQSEEKKKLLQLLKALEIFPNMKLVRQLRSQLKDKIEKIESRTTRFSKRERVKEETKIKTKISRSGKLRKYHHYIRLIHDNFPDIPYSQIRDQFKVRKEGKEVSIPDVIWQNPSP